MGYLLIGLLALMGVGTIFVVPWVGAGLLALAVIGAVALMFGSAFAGADGRRDEPVDTGLPGPGNPRSGVEPETREL
jgi:hypothetical protein